MRTEFSLFSFQFVFIRFEFYKQAKESFAVVHTGETALYGNIILQKGVIQA